MKAKLVGVGCVALLAFIATATWVRAGQDEKNQGGDMAGHDQMAKQWEMLAQPGPQHEHLKKMEGRWNAVVKWWKVPGGEPDVSYGKATYKMILGGRFVEETFLGESSDGKPFEGRGTYGYDNLQKKYVSTWIDSMGTGIMMMEGQYNESAKVMTLSGDMHTPMGKSTMRIESHEVNDNEVVANFFWPDQDGNDYKGMEITYKRM